MGETHFRIERWLIAFPLILPFAEVFAAMLVLILPALLVFINLENLAHGSDAAHVTFGNFSETIPRDNFVSFATQSSANQSSHLLTALNMPGMFGEVLVSLPTVWPDSWHPKGITLDGWRSVIMPFFSLPAWIIVGFGVDALLSWRRLHWGVLLIGTILCIFFIVILVGLSIMYFTSEHEDSAWILVGLSLWSALFGTLPAVWIKQWRAGMSAKRRNVPASLGKANQFRRCCHKP